MNKEDYYYCEANESVSCLQGDDENVNNKNANTVLNTSTDYNIDTNFTKVFSVLFNDDSNNNKCTNSKDYSALFDKDGSNSSIRSFVDVNMMIVMMNFS